MARCHAALCCAPQPVARFLQLFPKLALLFLIIHVSAMIYSIMKPAPTRVKYTESNLPAGVVDQKMVGQEESKLVRAIRPMHSDNSTLDNDRNKTDTKFLLDSSKKHRVKSRRKQFLNGISKET